MAKSRLAMPKWVCWCQKKKKLRLLTSEDRYFKFSGHVIEQKARHVNKRGHTSSSSSSSFLIGLSMNQTQKTGKNLEECCCCCCFKVFLFREPSRQQLLTGFFHSHAASSRECSDTKCSINSGRTQNTQVFPTIKDNTHARLLKKSLA